MSSVLNVGKEHSVTSIHAPLGRLLIETVVTTLAIYVINLSSKQCAQVLCLSTREIVRLSKALFLSSFGVREIVEKSLIREEMGKAQKMSIRLAGSVVGLLVGAVVLNRFQQVASLMQLHALSLRKISLITLSQFSLVSLPLALARFYFEEKKGSKTQTEEKKVIEEKAGPSNEKEPKPPISDGETEKKTESKKEEPGKSNETNDLASFTLLNKLEQNEETVKDSEKASEMKERILKQSGSIKENPHNPNLNSINQTQSVTAENPKKKSYSPGKEAFLKDVTENKEELEEIYDNIHDMREFFNQAKHESVEA